MKKTDILNRAKRNRDEYGKTTSRTRGVSKTLVIYLKLSYFLIISAIGGEYV